MSGLPPVVVVGADCPTGLQAARILAARGIRVIGLAVDPSHPCARTRAYARVAAAGEPEEEIVAALLDLASSLDTQAVILPCTDRSVLAVARHRPELASGYHVVVPDIAIVERLMDKARFAEFAQREGFPIPTTRVLRSRYDAEAAAEEITLPSILKPAMKTALWERSTSAKAFRVPTPASLVSLWDRCSAWTDVLVVQEWIDGDDREHTTCNCYLGTDGAPLVTFTARKLRQWPLRVGQGCLSEEHRSDGVCEQTVRLFNAAGHTGLGYLEFKRDPASGRDLILEANVGRPTGRSAAAEAGGVEFLMTMYCDALGLPLPGEHIQRYGPTKWVYLRKDLQAATTLWWGGGTSLGEIARSWKGPRAYALLSVRDPVPFVADLLRAAGHAARRPAGSSPGPVTGSPGRGRSMADGRGGDGLVVDFGTAGLARVRAVSPSQKDVKAMTRVLGPPDPDPSGGADLVIRFVDRLAVSDLRLLGGRTTGYADDGLYVLRSSEGPAVACLRFPEAAGHPPVIVCQRELSGVPLLQEMVDLHAIQRGWVPLHASAWTIEGVGTVAVGWEGSGKTGALLTMCESGAGCVGDDRVFISPDGRRMVGIPRPVRMRDWHLDQLPRLARHAGLAHRTFARGSGAMHATERWLARSGADPGPFRKLASRGLRGIRRRMSVELPVDAMFRIAAPLAPSPDVFLLLESHRSDTFQVRPLSGSQFADRVAATVEAEILPMLRMHLSFRFAFPERSWTAMERAGESIRDRLREAASGKPAYEVRHPYPCSLSELRSTIEPLCSPSGPTVGNGRVSHLPQRSLR